MEEFELTNDLLFQRVFGKVGNENITKGFLEKVLGIEIESLTLDTNKRLIGENLDDKIGRVDVKAILNTGTKVIIEMQVVRYKYMAKRLLYYWSQTYSGDLKRGREYDRLNKTIAILISVEELERITADPELREKYEYREKELRDILSMVKAEREDGVEEGYKTGLEKGRKEGFNQGIEQGIEEKNIEIVLNMYKKNMDIETISEIVNISKEEVEKIIVENN